MIAQIFVETQSCLVRNELSSAGGQHRVMTGTSERTISGEPIEVQLSLLLAVLHRDIVCTQIPSGWHQDLIRKELHVAQRKAQGSWNVPQGSWRFHDLRYSTPETRSVAYRSVALHYT